MKKLKYSWLLATALTACAIPTAGSVHDTYKPLFWPQEKRQIAFADAQNFVDVSTVEKGTFVNLLTVGPELKLTGDLDEYFETQNIAGLIVTHKGQIRLEKYAGGLTPEKDWSSFSVAKSITSTLVGAAIKDGHIDSLDSFVTDYIPELKDTAYEGVTIKHLLTMTSGVKWSENYSSPLSDVAKFIQHTPKNGLSITLDYMRQLKRSATPGEKFNYNTGETNLAGILVARATEQTLSPSAQRARKLAAVASPRACVTMPALLNLYRAAAK